MLLIFYYPKNPKQILNYIYLSNASCSQILSRKRCRLKGETSVSRSNRNMYNCMSVYRVPLHKIKSCLYNRGRLKTLFHHWDYYPTYFSKCCTKSKLSFTCCLYFLGLIYFKPKYDKINNSWCILHLKQTSTLSKYLSSGKHHLAVVLIVFSSYLQY